MLSRIRTERRCSVCRATREYFTRFAPCTSCFPCTRDDDGHHPAGKARFHINYCSLSCYNNPYRGRQAKLHAKWTRHDRARGGSGDRLKRAKVDYGERGPYT